MRCNRAKRKRKSNEQLMNLYQELNFLKTTDKWHGKKTRRKEMREKETTNKRTKESREKSKGIKNVDRRQQLNNKDSNKKLT